jgi:hypothetical protein
MAANPHCLGQKRRLVSALIAGSGKAKLQTAQQERKLGVLGWLLVAPVLGLMSACSSAVGDTAGATGAAAQTATAAKKTAATIADPLTAFKVGTNVNTINWWDGSRPFENLIYGTGWTMQNTNPWGGGEDLPPGSLDANGWVKSVPTGYRVGRGLSVPAAGGDFICRYQGNGQLTVQGPVSNVSYSAGATRFTIASTYPNPQSVSLYYYVDPTNYIRNIDCRETNAPTTAVFAPEFLTAMNGFKVVRFMKWQSATESNRPVTWATRNKPGDGDYNGNDGVPVEVMVDAANQLNADAWFTVPWNADDDYITRFATYVRDNLASGHVAYVETSNEVWNGGYPVYTQAKNEAIAEKLPSAVTPGAIADGPGERYAERTRQVMQIWSTVFSGQMNRLVRVAAFQHVAPYWTNALVKYQNLYQSIDAIATAPYFGYDLNDSMTADQILAALPGKANDALNFAQQQKSIAQSYGLRYITYEAGQHIVLPNNVPLLAQVERDSRMADVYNQFISSWQSQIGDTLTLFALTGAPARYGSWGALEYNGQPLTQAPKMRAIQPFLGIATATNTTQVCPDGSVIPSTSTCPAPTPTTQVCPDGSVIPITSTCPAPTSGGTTGGKKRGGGKGGGKGGTAVA